VLDGGEVFERVRLGMPCFACMLGATTGRRCSCWRIADSPDDNITQQTTRPRTGQVLTARAPAAGAGWP
jgi:hypothetical protein